MTPQEALTILDQAVSCLQTTRANHQQFTQAIIIIQTELKRVDNLENLNDHSTTDKG